MRILNFLSIILIAGVVTTSCSQKPGTSNKPIVTDVDSLSYSIGMQIGANIGDTFETIDKELFMEGFVTFVDSLEGKMELDDANEFIQAYMKKNQADIRARQQAAQARQQAAQAKKKEEEFKVEKEAGENFLEENRNKEGVITTESGLQYIVLNEGSGEKPTTTSRVKVHYHGTLTDGTVFDSSVDRGEPSTFGVTQVIKGWTEGLQLMPVGSKYKFFIPQELAYGANPRPGGAIKPFSALIFDVELLEIVEDKK